MGAAAKIFVGGNKAHIARPLHRHGNLGRPIGMLSARAQTVRCGLSHPAITLRQRFIDPLDDLWLRACGKPGEGSNVGLHRRRFLKLDRACVIGGTGLTRQGSEKNKAEENTRLATHGARSIHPEDRLIAPRRLIL
jgi:hypothetical protein